MSADKVTWGGSARRAGGGASGRSCEAKGDIPHARRRHDICCRVCPWFRNELKWLAKARKLHFFDSGLAAALRRIDPEALGPDRTGLGPLVETFVFSELSKHATRSEDPVSIHHYRDHDGGEIGFIPENRSRQVVAIEVKAGATVRPETFNTMRKLADVLKDKFALGILLYDGQHRIQYDDKLWAASIGSF